MQRHRRENGRSAILDSETVEWLNAILAKLWPILNTDLLLPALDIVEDAMKDRFPTIIDTVRIDDLDLGVTPFRVLSIKQLDPDQPIAERHELDSDSTRHVNMEIDFEYRAQRHEGSTGVRDWPPMILYMGLEVSPSQDLPQPFVTSVRCSANILFRMSPGQRAYASMDIFRSAEVGIYRSASLRRAFAGVRDSPSTGGIDIRAAFRTVG